MESVTDQKRKMVYTEGGEEPCSRRSGAGKEPCSSRSGAGKEPCSSRSGAGMETSDRQRNMVYFQDDEIVQVGARERPCPNFLTKFTTRHHYARLSRR